MLQKIILPVFIMVLFSCGSSETPATATTQDENEDSIRVAEYYAANKGNDLPSKSTGTTGNGKLVNGKLLPFSGENFRYFSVSSYLGGRAFVNGTVRDILLDAFSELTTSVPDHQFTIMECSEKEGGSIFPHRTHQNGLSVDMMMPLKKNGKTYYGLDSVGASHYLLTFDDNGRYSKDKDVQIDFDLVAQQILTLEKQARKHGMKIAKVIIKMELKDELFATPHGKQLQASGIYITKNLDALINSLHDDHFHVDFQPL